MSHIEQHIFHLACCNPSCGYVFRIMCDYPDDIKASSVADDGSPGGYAIFRDKFLVQCPECKVKGAKLIPGSISMEIDKR